MQNKQPDSGRSGLSRLPVGHCAVQVWGFVVAESWVEAGLPDVLLVCFCICGCHITSNHSFSCFVFFCFVFLICLFVSQSALPALNYNYCVCVCVLGWSLNLTDMEPVLTAGYVPAAGPKDGPMFDRCVRRFVSESDVLMSTGRVT